MQRIIGFWKSKLKQTSYATQIIVLTQLAHRKVLKSGVPVRIERFKEAKLKALVSDALQQ